MSGNTKAALQQRSHRPDPPPSVSPMLHSDGCPRRGTLEAAGWAVTPTPLPDTSAQGCCSPSGKAGRGFIPLLQDSPWQLLGTTGKQKTSEGSILGDGWMWPGDREKRAEVSGKQLKGPQSAPVAAEWWGPLAPHPFLLPLSPPASSPGPPSHRALGGVCSN